MGILSWIVLGLIAGVAANAIDPRPAKGGILSTIMLGILGAIVGGFLSSMLFGVDVSGFNLTSLLVAVGGALVLLFVGRMLNRSTA